MSTSRTYTALTALPAASLNDLAQGTLGYAPVTANQGTFTTVVDLTGLTVTVTLVAGRRIRITAFCHFGSTAANDEMKLTIMEGATQLASVESSVAVANRDEPYHREVILTPSVGSHTYKLQGQRSIGTGNVTMVASATNPAFILVEDIGT